MAQTPSEKLLEQHLFDNIESEPTPTKAAATTASTKKRELTAAWEDEDDEQVAVDLVRSNRLKKLRKHEQDDQVDGKEYQQRLKDQYQAKSSALSWAKLPSDSKKSKTKTLDSDSEAEDDQDDEANALLRSTETLLDSSAGGKLQSGFLQVSRMKDANYQSPSNAVVQSVEFHSNGQMLLTAGFDKTLRLFQIDGVNNPKLQSVFFPDLPISCATFSRDTRVIVSGQRPYFYSYDLNSGKEQKIPRILGRKEKKLDKFVTSKDGKWLVFLGSDGYMSLLNAKSYQWVANLKMNGNVRSASFSADSQTLLSCGTDGEVYNWDLRTRRCLFRHTDEGSVDSRAISQCSNGLYAVGSDSGVVNVYRGKPASSTPKPEKTLMHLTTPVHNAKFNSDGQILAMSSRDIKDSLKLVHLPSYTVFSNWPTSKTPLHYVSAMDFSPSSGYFAVGNDRGRVLLYRLNHYSST